jgi:5-formyltetrahydrofolate cyclo-ligase
MPPDPARDARRVELLAARAALTDRAEREKVLCNRVTRWLRTMPVARLGFFWPVRGEPDLTAVVAQWLAAAPGRSAGLPVVVGDQLEFAPWSPGVPMEKGAFGIPVPARNARMAPQLLLIPCLGIDALRYRLGYGGGFYDRTLAGLKVKPVTVGIGFDVARIASIGPKPHDVRLELAITESGVL